MLTYQPKIALRDMRTSGVRDVLIYCRDHRCSHYIESVRSFRRPNGDRLKRARWCIKSVHASASRRFGNERDRGNFCDQSSPMEGWMTTTKQDIDAALARLTEAFPQTFVLEKYRPHRPLKVGIAADIPARCPAGAC